MPPKLTKIQLYPLPHRWNFSLPTSDSNTSMCSPLLVDHSDYDGESVEEAVDLNACTAVEYEQKDE